MISRDSKRKESIVSEIILSNYNSYFRLAMSFVHNEEDAADIVQEGAYKAIKNSDSLKQTEYAQTWVYRIMVNETFRVLKARKFEAAGEAAADIGYDDSYEDVDLKRAMEALTVKDQAVIKLKYFEDMKLEDIAMVLNEKLSTVKSRLYRSLKKLRLDLETEDQ